ncbi:isopenicillin N synthase family dioxygenase [Streptomyces sp. NPDC056480]|uniref:isopenicillin N synthase family dioxygenase n=1 Tax=Streptomyces sp. NPDC056480 TaxID=3345833 RepID=UPI00367BDA81
MDSIPLIDLTPWWNGDTPDRDLVASQVDAALQDHGFLLVTGHGIPLELRRKLRTAARQYFTLPHEVKEQYAVTMGGRGWLRSGLVTAGRSEGTMTPPDLKETFAFGAAEEDGGVNPSPQWFKPNVYPQEVPELEALVTEFLSCTRQLADELLRVCASALGVEDGFFAEAMNNPFYTMNLNWYPSLATLREPVREGQFRIGPHTDFGTITILDREPGMGGLQVYGRDGHWREPACREDALVINIGDLLAYWSGGRWRSSRHRVIPPAAASPNEDQLSLIFFLVAAPAAQITPVSPSLEGYSEPVVAEDFLMERIRRVSQTPAG